MSNLGPYQELTSAAKQAGGVENLINSIKNEGYQDGHEDGVILGVILAGVVGGVVLLSKKSIEIIKSKRKKVHERAETSKDTLKQIRNMIKNSLFSFRKATSFGENYDLIWQKSTTQKVTDVVLANSASSA